MLGHLTQPAIAISEKLKQGGFAAVACRFIASQQILRIYYALFVESDSIHST